MTNPNRAKHEREHITYREEAEADVNEAIVQLHFYQGKVGDFINLKNAAQYIKMAMRCHVHSEHLAGNTLDMFISPAAPEETPSAHLCPYREEK